MTTTTAATVVTNTSSTTTTTTADEDLTTTTIPSPPRPAVSGDSQENQEGDGGEKKTTSRGSGYTPEEDLCITKAYFRASEDKAKGTKQKVHVFRASMLTIYNDLIREQVEYNKKKIGNEDDDLLDSTNLVVEYCSRTGSSIHQRYQKYIAPSTVKFLGIVKATEKASGTTDVDHLVTCRAIYKDRFDEDYKFLHCYEWVKSKAKYASLMETEDLARTDSATKRASSSSVGSKANRPEGCKRFKKSKQQEQQLAQAPPRQPPAPALNIDGMNGLVSSVTNGINMWVLQACMAGNIDASLRSQLSNELANKQLLELRLENKRGMAELAEEAPHQEDVVGNQGVPLSVHTNSTMTAASDPTVHDDIESVADNNN